MNRTRSLLVIADEHFVPANHGGRVDRWNRWQWLKSLGWSLRLIAWESPKGTARRAEDIAAEGHVFDETFSLHTDFGVKGVWKRVSRFGLVPLHAASRAVTRRDYLGLRARIVQNCPDAIVLDGLYGALLALRLARDLDIPLIYRAHNVEYLYMAGQARSAVALPRKLALRLATIGLRQFETGLRRRVNWSLDISMDDLRHWQSAGLSACSWAPPLFNPAEVSAATKTFATPDHDLVYLGNLNTPNNLAGLDWFLSQVLPSLQAQRTDMTLLLAGSNPHADIVRRARTTLGVTLLANPPEAHAVLARGRVIINPILSGSGVNIKTIEALLHVAPVVTTPIGAQGLPDEVRRNLIIAGSPEEFAKEIAHALQGHIRTDPARMEVLEQFGRLGAENLSVRLQRVLQNSIKPNVKEKAAR